MAPGLAADTAPAPPGAVYGGRTTQAHPMSMAVTRIGKGLRAFFTRVDVGPCTDSRTFNIAFDFPKSLDTPVAHGGGFTIATPINGPAATGEHLDLRLNLKGKVGSGRAAGTLRLAGSIRDTAGNETDRCDSGLVRWTLKRRATYGGRLMTADHGAVTIRLDSTGKVVRSFLVDFPIVCGSTTYRFTLEHLNIPVRRGHRFSKHGVSGVRLTGPDGSTVSGQYSVRGKLGLRTATGTYRAFGTARARDGTKAHCESGTIRWTAARG